MHHQFLMQKESIGLPRFGRALAISGRRQSVRTGTP
jgi:hypothetical protein